MPRLPRLLALALLAATAAPALAQLPGDDLSQPKPKRPKGTAYDLADITYTVTPAKAKRGETVTARLTITPTKPGAYTYPFFPKDPSQSARNKLGVLPVTPDLVFLPPADPPGLKEKPREDGDGKIDQYYPGPVTWEFKAVIPLKASAGKKVLTLGDEARLLVCNARNCLPLNGAHLPTAELEILDSTTDSPNTADLTEAAKLLGGASRRNPPTPPIPGPRVGPESQPTPGPQVGPTPAPAPPPSAADAGRKLAKPLDTYRLELEDIQKSLVFDNPGAAGGGGTRAIGTQNEELGAFLATAALWGLISLVTPCVFPMIPITVSIFLKQAHGSLGERLKLAGVYSLTIITVLGFSAFALLKFMAVLAAHPATNIALGVLFFVLALSLFGMYELTLPNSLARRLQSKQAKGGVVGTVFGALAFTVISFTCVAPFLGGFAGISAAGGADGGLIAVPTTREILGGLAFATAFAAPFFVLALVPGLLKALPRSGGWLDSVKVVMGFLELAAALKFLRTAELRLLPTPEYFTYDLVLAGWVAIAAACGLYLLNVYRLPHDEERPNIGVPRLLFAAGFLGLALYLLPALFKTPEGKHPRPAGAVYAWVEAFLLPEHEAGAVGTDLRAAIEQARKTKKPVFLDFTGETCTNCKYNEHTVFTRSEVRGLLDQFEEVQLYTDDVPAGAYRSDPGVAARRAEAKANGSFQELAFGDVALPMYLVLIPQADGRVRVFREPAGERRDRYEGKINNPADFAAFLRAALEAK